MADRPLRPCARCGRLFRAGGRCPACMAAYERSRGTARERGYTAKWDAASREYRLAHPVCVLCGEPSQVVDHVRAHKGDEALFWDRTNWQALCSRCNNSKRAREEGGFGR